MAQTETKVLTTHVPLPLAEKVDQMAARLERVTQLDNEAGTVSLD